VRAVIQRVSEAKVTIDGQISGQIDAGLVVLLGVALEDTERDAEYLAAKISGLRIFADDEDKMNLSLVDTGGAMLIISQFTLFGDCRKGRRPSFTAAASGEHGEKLYDHFVAAVKNGGIPVATGEFGAHMDVSLVNNGPVTMLLDSAKLF